MTTSIVGFVSYNEWMKKIDIVGSSQLCSVPKTLRTVGCIRDEKSREKAEKAGKAGKSWGKGLILC
jgi:hypothetical protein